MFKGYSTFFDPKPGTLTNLNDLAKVIYTVSSLVEQSTPTEHLIFDAFATVGGCLGYLGLVVGLSSFAPLSFAKHVQCFRYSSWELGILPFFRP